MEKISLKKIKRFSAQKETWFLFVSLILMTLTPLFIPVNLNLPIEKGPLESILLFIFSIIALVSAYLYEKKINKKRNEADEVLNYLGTINLQFAHAKSIFEDIKNFPESKTDFKLLLSSLAEKALGINNADWVIFRIIDLTSKKMLIEHNHARGGKTLPEKNKISNRTLLENNFAEEYVAIASSQENLGIKTFCILSTKEINENQKALMGVITNNLSLYYLLFVSVFHKK